jgi:hypothetical protein
VNGISAFPFCVRWSDGEFARLACWTCDGAELCFAPLKGAKFCALNGGAVFDNTGRKMSTHERGNLWIAGQRPVHEWASFQFD